jgi:hypothetical protein
MAALATSLHYHGEKERRAFMAGEVPNGASSSIVANPQRGCGSGDSASRIHRSAFCSSEMVAVSWHLVTLAEALSTGQIARAMAFGVGVSVQS